MGEKDRSFLLDYLAEYFELFGKEVSSGDDRYEKARSSCAVTNAPAHW
jgi:hypothetical protein